MTTPTAKRTADLRALLRRRYQAPEWLVLDEAHVGAGRHIDCMAFNLYASRGHSVVGCEIKMDRSDWLRERRDPGKADGAWALCHELYLVAMPGVVLDPDDELPPGWVTHAAAEAQARAEYLRGLGIGRQSNATELELARSSAEHQRAIRAAFEDASGVRIDQYSAGHVGDAVRLVLDSGRGSDLRTRFWRLYLDALEATAGLARGVATLGGPPTERSYRDGDAQRELYEHLVAAPAEVNP
jgi:hypothetical protein